jgi:hypothetical protein
MLRGERRGTEKERRETEKGKGWSKDGRKN